MDRSLGVLRSTAPQGDDVEILIITKDGVQTQVLELKKD